MVKKILLLLGCILILHMNISFAGDYQIFWGDVHTHTSYSDDAYLIQDDLGLAPAQPAEAFQYAANVAGLDFVALTDHAEHLQLYRDEKGNLIPNNTGHSIDEWQDTIAQSSEGLAPSELVIFLGFEYTKTAEDAQGNPVPGAGHKCVIFKNGHVPQFPISAVEGKPLINSPYAALPSDLWTQLDAGGFDYMTIPHHPAKGTSAPISPETNMSTDWDYVNATRQSLVEVFSVHGSSDYKGCPDEVDQFVSEKSVEAALNLWLSTGSPGYQLGVIASTDGHLSRPGFVEPEDPDNMVHQEGDYTGGLVAVLATEKNHEAIWDALVHRRTYGTTGPRIKINTFSITYDGTVYQMGETIHCQGDDSPQVTIQVDIETDTNDPEIVVVTKSTIENPVSEGILPSTNQPWIVQTDSDHPLCSSWEGKRVNMTLADTITSARTYYRLTVRQKPTIRYTWNAVTREYTQIQTRERAWSSPIFVTATPVLYVHNKDDLTCGGKIACYSTIQAALDVAGDECVIKVAQGAYDEAPLKNTPGTVTISGGWDDLFKYQTQQKTSMHALRVTQGALILQEVLVIP